LRARADNPFLPKPALIRWRKGPFVKAKGVPQPPKIDRSSDGVSELPPASRIAPVERREEPRQPASHSPHGSIGVHRAGTLSYGRENFFCESSSGWGSNLDMLALAHGAVGCNSFAQTTRLNLPGFMQGVDSFTALDVSTNLTLDDLEDGGDAKLTRSLAEAQELFPLAKGVTVLSEEPLPLIDANVKGVAKTVSKESGKPIVAMGCEIAGAFNWTLDVAAGLRTVGKYVGEVGSGPYDVAIPFCRTTPGLVWIVSKLLTDIGLNPIHERTGSSASDMSRIRKCKLIIGFAESLDVAQDYLPDGNAQLLGRWFGIPLLWTCFLSPAATELSLRMIANHFGPEIQLRAEQVIAANRRKIENALSYYRPRLQNKLVLDFFCLPDAQLDCYRMLGFRIGSFSGWLGKTGVWRKPRRVCDANRPDEAAIDSYIAEAKPDLVIYLRRFEEDWHKRGQPVVPFSPLFDHNGDSHWGFDGFLCLAAAIDRAVNAPWRHLVKPPWSVKDG